jgi:hypothetical protein
MAVANLARWVVASALLLGAVDVRPQTASNLITLPARVDLNPRFGQWHLAVKKQGPRPTCSVFTTVAAMEYAVSIKSRVGVRLSEEYLNWAANQITRRTNDGGQFFSNLVKGYNAYGIATEVTMPYRAQYSPSYAPSAAAESSAGTVKSYRLRAHWIKENDGQVGVADIHLLEAKRALAAGWPVCAGSYHSVLFAGYRDGPGLPGGGEFLVRDPGGGNEQTMSYEAAKKRLCDLVWFDCEPAGDAKRNPPRL